MTISIGEPEVTADSRTCEDVSAASVTSDVRVLPMKVRPWSRSGSAAWVMEREPDGDVDKERASHVPEGTIRTVNRQLKKGRRDVQRILIKPALLQEMSSKSLRRGKQ